ncbi:MAG: GNAT family N-acetyltransferase [Solirubrobacteraceae bacterium]
MPAIPSLSERLADAVVELREIAEWDIPEILIAHQDDRSLHRRLGLGRPPTGAQLGSEVESAAARRQDGLGVSLTLTAPGGNDCAGRVDVSAIDWERGSAQLSVWVAPALRGRGIAAHALALASGWLTGSVGLTELEVAVSVDEEPGQGA